MGSFAEEILCPWSSGLAASCYERNDPFGRTVAVSAPVAIEVSLLLDIAQYEAQGFVTSNAAALS